MAIIEVRNVKYRYESKYQTVNALNGVNCSFEEGRLYALVGKSGSGKSTLLSLMAGLMLPSEGEILFNGTPTSAIDLNRYRRENAAVIYQSFRLLPLLTVEENVTYPMEIRGFKGGKARERAAELIRKVGLPDSALDRFPNMLSGGEQQRVAVARAMSMDTRLLLADEPTGNLDTENGRRIIDLLLDLAHNEGYCVVVVTHDPEIAARADVTYRIRDGVLYEQTDPSKTASDRGGTDEKTAACEQRIRERREREEADRAAARETAKKRRKTAGIVLSALAACAAFTVLLFTVILPAIRYSRADALYSAGKYGEAIAAFAALDGYRDSEARILDCRYGIAEDLCAAGEYEAAMTAFADLGGYRDSAERVEACKSAITEQKYAAAMAFLDAGRYEEAYPALIALDGCRDSAEKAREIFGAYKTAKLRHAEVGDYVLFGAYEQDNDTSDGKEDIEWLVLAKNDDRILLISRYALDFRQYNSTDASVSWETCTLRKWLNETFVSSAFTADELNRILDTAITDDNDPGDGSAPGNGPTDKVFLLSHSEVYKYFDSDRARMCAPTDYAVSLGAGTSGSNTVDGRPTCWWWLRLNVESDWHASCVNIDGSVYFLDLDLYLAYNAVRPVVWIRTGEN